MGDPQLHSLVFPIKGTMGFGGDFQGSANSSVQPIFQGVSRVRVHQNTELFSIDLSVTTLAFFRLNRLSSRCPENAPSKKNETDSPKKQVPL